MRADFRRVEIGSLTSESLLFAGRAHWETVGTDAIHLLVDVVAEVGHVKNAASIIEPSIHEVFPKSFKDG
jgi:hypothetical protein